MGLGGFETGGEVQFGPHIFRDLDPHIGFLSTNSTKQGWFYYILKPGVYYLAFDFGRSSPSVSQKSIQRWRIEIPDGSPLIYGGSIDVSYSSEYRLINVLKNEEALATKIASEYMPELGAPKALLLQRHSGPIIIRKPK